MEVSTGFCYHYVRRGTLFLSPLPKPNEGRVIQRDLPLICKNALLTDRGGDLSRQECASILHQAKEFEKSMLETVQQDKSLLWIIVPMVYEKWVHPGSKAKHYRAIFRSPTGRRYSKTKFKTATQAMEFAAKFNVHVCKRRVYIPWEIPFVR